MAKAAVTLRIVSPTMSLAFTVPEAESLQGEYTAELKDNTTEFTTHPLKYIWKKGQFGEQIFKVDVVAGITPGVATPEQVTGAIEQLIDLALPPTPSVSVLEVARFYIVGANGTAWYNKRGVVKKVAYTFDSPYDVQTGRPMAAHVTITMQPVFANGDSNQTAQHPSDTPRRHFTFSGS